VLLLMGLVVEGGSGGDVVLVLVLLVLLVLMVLMVTCVYVGVCARSCASG
jgi:hypothetical protein